MTEPETVNGGPPDKPAGMSSGSWKQIVRRIPAQVKHDNLTDRAAALTYHGVLALFPGLLVLISILGLVGRSTTDKILNNLEQVAPGSVKSFLTSTVQHVQGRSGAASIAAVAGILIALWSASGYVAAFMRASNAIYNIDEGRPAWQKIPTRLAITVTVVILLVVSALLVVLTGQFADQAGKAFGIGHTAVVVWDIAKWPVLLVIVSFMFSLLYWASPNVRQPGFRWITPGGVLAVVIWLVASGLFALYLSFSSSYNKTYGSVAAVIIFLVWLWISNLAILLGLEFNAETERQRAIEAGLDPSVEPFVELRSTKKLDDEERQRVEEADRRRASEMH